MGSRREVRAEEITGTVEKRSAELAYVCGREELAAICRARKGEERQLGQAALDDLLKNAEIADTVELTICQDTRSAVVFINWGQDAHLLSGTVTALAVPLVVAPCHLDSLPVAINIDRHREVMS